MAVNRSYRRRFSDVEFGKNLANPSSQNASTSNCRFKFEKRSQLFIRVHNEKRFPSSRCASA